MELKDIVYYPDGSIKAHPNRRSHNHRIMYIKELKEKIQ